MTKRLLAILLSLTMIVTFLPVFALAEGYAITNGTPKSAKETNHGYITVDETATEGETVTVTVNPNEGYQLKSLTVTPAAPTEYIVTFDLNGVTGTAPEAQTITSGEKATKPTDPTFANHTFAGWHKTKDATTGVLSDPWDFDNDTVTADMTLYAQWERTMESILSTNPVVPQVTDLTPPSNAWANSTSPDCKAFVGIDAEGDTLFVVKKEGQGVQSLGLLMDDTFVRINENTYKYNDDYVTVIANMTDGKFTSCEWKFILSNYQFLDGTYTAPVVPAEYNVTFDLNGITGTAPEAQTITSGEKATKPADPTDTIHTFAGWYKTKDATSGALSDPWDFDTDTVTADMTLYAKWTRTLESIYTGSDIPKVTNNSAPDDAWVNGDGGKAFIAFSTGNTVLYLYKQLQPSGAKQLSCRKTENFTKIGDDYVLFYELNDRQLGVYTLHMTDGKFTSVTYDGAGTDYEVLSGTYAAPANMLLKSLAPKLLKSSAPVDPETITPEKQQDGTYQFTMPAYAVTVTAEFEAAPKYTEYENWQIKHEGSEWQWTENLTKVEDGLYKIEINWKGSGFNVKSDENPIKKDWFAPEELTLGEELIAPVTVDVYLRVIDDETLKIGVGVDPAPAHTHDPVLVNGQAATETASGWRDYYECDCGALFEDENGTTPIENLDAWKSQTGNGYIAPIKPTETGTEPTATGTEPTATGTEPTATGTEPTATGTEPTDPTETTVDLRIGDKEFYGVKGGMTLEVESLDDLQDITVLVQNGVDVEGMSEDWSMSTKFLDSEGRGVLEVQVFEEGDDYVTFNLQSHYADCPGANVEDFQIMMITAKLPTVEKLLGDANDDGLVNMKDVLTIRKVLAGIDVPVYNAVNADCNVDGEVNMKDVLMLRKYLANIIDTLGA